MRSYAHRFSCWEASVSAIRRLPTLPSSWQTPLRPNQPPVQSRMLDLGRGANSRRRARTKVSQSRRHPQGSSRLKSIAETRTSYLVRPTLRSKLSVRNRQGVMKQPWKCMTSPVPRISLPRLSRQVRVVSDQRLSHSSRWTQHPNVESCTCTRGRRGPDKWRK